MFIAVQLLLLSLGARLLTSTWLALISADERVILRATGRDACSSVQSGLRRADGMPAFVYIERPSQRARRTCAWTVQGRGPSA